MRLNFAVEVATETLRRLIAAVDSHLADICKESAEVSDPDGYGYFDSAEDATGLGFVACQTYMANVYGMLRIQKHLALQVGSRHSSGLPKVQIINHAANYWKHNSEWPLDRSESRRTVIERAFESVGFPVGTDYPLSRVLTELTSPSQASFESVLSILESWKYDLVNYRCA